jgi:hypothetical protein
MLRTISLRLQGSGLSSPGTQISQNSRQPGHLLTRQVLSFIVAIRLGGSRAALRRQIKLTRRPLSSFRSHRLLVKAVGILVPVGTCETCSQMPQIIEIADLLLLQSGRQSGTVFQLARRQRPNRLKTKNLW